MVKNRINIPTKVELDLIFQKFGLERGVTMAEGIMRVDIDKLRPHPQNELIYGDEDVSDLVTQIEVFGRIVEPIKIKDDYTIISGHRRWRAAKELKYTTVPCEIVRFDSPEEELAALVLYNYKRVKTNEQKAREGIALFETLSVEAVKRRLENLNHGNPDMDDSSTSENNGDNSVSDNANADAKQEVGFTRDKVAEAVGIKSGRTFDRMKAVIKKADELKGEGKFDDSAMFLDVLNRSASAAYDLMAVPLELLVDDVRENIKTGKVTPRMLLQGQVTGKSKRKSYYEKSIDNIEIMGRTIKALKKSVKLIKDDEEQDEIRFLLKDTLCQYLQMLSFNQCVHCNFILATEFLDFSITSIIKSLSEPWGVDSLEECKDIINGEMEALQQLLSVIDAKINKENEIASTTDEMKDEN